jgi:hypothetical protein
MKIEIDLAGSLRSKRNRNFPLQNALLELIDNSVDEGANTINIIESHGDLIIEDNGHGFKDIEAALRIGTSSKENKIGRFGVGLKDACLRYSDATVIESNGKRVDVPWLKIIKSYHDGEIETEDIEVRSMTRIILQNFRERYKSSIETREICRTYHPMLTGRRLNINVLGKKLEPLMVPELTEYIKEEIIFDGKKCIIYGGIYKTNDPARIDWKGYNPYYNGRLIGNGKITNRGTGQEYCNNFFFQLFLLDDLEPWGLATNKDEVTGLDELLDYIYHAHTRPILERGAEQASDIELKGIENQINMMLGNQGNITRGPKVNKPEQKKEHKKGSPKKNTNTATQVGSYNNGASGKRGSVKFLFKSLGGDSLGEYEYRDKSGLFVTANSDNSFIAQNRTNLPAIQIFVMMSYAMHRKSQSSFEMFPDNFTTSILEIAGSELAWIANQLSETN